MTRRILGVALTSTGVALALFLIPLAIAVFGLFQADAYSSLESEALHAAATVDPTFSGTDKTELPHPGQEVTLALYDASGNRLLGSAPATADAVVTRTLRGQSSRGEVDGALVLAVPLSSSENVTGAIRASIPLSSVWHRIVTVWLVILAGALAAVGIGTLLALRLSRRITMPMRTLADASQRLGSGDFDVRMTFSGLQEIDQVAEALNSTAGRLEGLVERERSLAAHASHQLRTPLTGLRASLEAATSSSEAELRSAVTVAIERADELNSTIDEVIALSRHEVSGSAISAAPELDAAEARWRAIFLAAGRPLRIDLEAGIPPFIGVAAALHQVLDVLLDNAYHHGSGEVTLRARTVYQSVAFDVEDEGTNAPPTDSIFEHGVSHAGGTGIGLALARQLAEDEGGRLLLSARQPNTRFTLLLPLYNEPAHP